MKVLLSLLPALAGTALAVQNTTAVNGTQPQPDLSALADTFETLTDSFLAKALSRLDERESCAKARGEEATCTRENVVLRKEYGDLTHEERLDYVNAVLCLQHLPPRTPANVSAGARSRYDDFIVTHIQQTLQIHYTGNFLPWHRWFTYSYEKALRDECGYRGYQPYWDWPKYASAPQDSPIFDGSPTSLGGNGESIVHDGPVLVAPDGLSTLPIPAGVGGGFVKTGPFANMSVNLGPVGGLDGVAPGPDGGLGYNPRRLKRDVGPAVNMRYANYSTVLNLLSKPNISEYRALSEGAPYTIEIGPHGGGHYVISGDPGGDLFTSPGDPAFYVHHGMMDRMWSYWQLLDPTSRHSEEEMNGGNYGHITWTNQPESRKASFSDKLDMGYAAESTTIGEVMDTTSGPFCYFYVLEAVRNPYNCLFWRINLRTTDVW